MIYIVSSKVPDDRIVLWDTIEVYVGLLWHVSGLLHEAVCAAVADNVAVDDSAAVTDTVGPYIKQHGEV